MSGRRLRLSIAIAACLLLPVAGCSELQPFMSEPYNLACPASTGGPLTLVIGARANSPRPDLPDEILALVHEAATQGSQITVIRVDGAPTVAVEAVFQTNGQNDAIRQRDLDNFMAQITAVVAGLQPKEPEADVVGALTEASRATPAGGTIVLLDSGLTTTGQLSFLDNAMFGVDPAEAAGYLQSVGLLPDLAERSVVLVRLGNTADPQPALDLDLGNRVLALWHTIAETAGASCVEDVVGTSPPESIDTDLAVSVVELPAPPVFEGCGTTVLGDGDTVGFLPDQAVFRDPAAARETLMGLAGDLVGGPQRVTLTGTTSSAGDSEPRRVALSERRAGAVKDVLVSLGVEGSRIDTVGAGSQWPDRVVDRGADGNLLPGPAAQNRSVVVEVICP